MLCSLDPDLSIKARIVGISVRPIIRNVTRGRWGPPTRYVIEHGRTRLDVNNINWLDGLQYKEGQNLDTRYKLSRNNRSAEAGTCILD